MKMLKVKWAEGKFVCVGLDSDIAQIPQHMYHHTGAGRGLNRKKTVVAFNKEIVDATADLVLAYKPNSAFYEAQGTSGVDAMQRSIEYAKMKAPDVVIVDDAKRGDIGKTNKGYVTSIFDFLGADAVTVHPYLGREALEPFLAQTDKGIIVLCRTSNPGAGEFQDLNVGMGPQVLPLYQVVAKHVAEEWNTRGNCAVVVGATYPEELKIVREIIGDMPILIPGLGSQGGDVEKTVAAGKNSEGQGMILNSSSGIIFASKERDFAEAARRETMKLDATVTHLLKEAA